MSAVTRLEVGSEVGMEHGGGSVLRPEYLSEPNQNSGCPTSRGVREVGLFPDAGMAVVEVLKMKTCGRTMFTRATTQDPAGFGKSPMSRTPRDMGHPGREEHPRFSTLRSSEPLTQISRNFNLAFARS